MSALKSILLPAALMLAFATTSFAATAALQSPDKVKNCLWLMMQVTNDFDRQITRKNYARLPHENEEFKEATGALTQAIANEPANFKAKVTRAIQKALAAAQKIADLRRSSDDAKLRTGHGKLLKAVNAVFAFFPENLRPDPNVQPGRAGGAPPAN